MKSLRNLFTLAVAVLGLAAFSAAHAAPAASSDAGSSTTLVELHKGSVDITSKIGVGTRVVCRLPINPSIAEAAE